MQSRWAWGVSLLVLVACGTATEKPGDDAGTPPGNDAGAVQDVYVPFGDSSSGDASCNPPDMLIVLDRSDSMKSPPDGDAGASKWSLAVAALDDITAAPIDGTLRFGLELLPDQNVKKSDAGACGAGVVSIDTGLGNGVMIASALSSTQLMNGTPIGGALDVARMKLAKEQIAGRGQNVLLVTDGKETCAGAPPLPVVQMLAGANVSTWVVGFGGAVDVAMLNDLACAGLMAKDFTNSCKKTSAGWVANVPDTTHVYYDATSGDDLKAALAVIASSTCCGCQVN